MRGERKSVNILDQIPSNITNKKILKTKNTCLFLTEMYVCFDCSSKRHASIFERTFPGDYQRNETSCFSHHLTIFQGLPQRRLPQSSCQRLVKRLDSVPKDKK